MSEKRCKQKANQARKQNIEHKQMIKNMQDTQQESSPGQVDAPPEMMMFCTKAVCSKASPSHRRIVSTTISLTLPEKENTTKREKVERCPVINRHKWLHKIKENKMERKQELW